MWIVLKKIRFQLRAFFLLLCAASAPLLFGCASAPLPLAVDAADHTSQLVLLELPPTVAPSVLNRLQSLGQDKPLDDAALEKMREDIQAQLDGAIHAALKEHGLTGVSVKVIPQAAGQTVGKPVSGQALQELQSISPARHYFRVSVSDFGETPRNWQDGYILLEVSSAAVVTTILYNNPSTRALAGIYLAEDVIEDVAKGYSGFWLVNRLSRPVRIEEDLIDGKDGNLLWHDSVMGMAEWHWQNLWHMDESQRKALLDESVKKAAEKLVRVLEGGSSAVPSKPE